MCAKAAGCVIELESFGNGLAYTLTRMTDGSAVFLQGDDALHLTQALEQTTEVVTDQDVLWPLFCELVNGRAARARS